MPLEDPSPRARLHALWQAALQSVGAKEAVARALPPRAAGRVIVVGAGKAAAAMAVAVVEAYGRDTQGIVVTRHGHGLRPGETSGRIRILEAGHPLPDDAGLEAGRAILQSVEGLGADDLVLCLLSGGGSALLEAPLGDVSLADLTAVNRRLLACGAPIAEINCVRKHLSAIKGGRLALAASPARVLTLAISDVPGDDPAIIASGPTVGDPTRSSDAREILARYQIDVSAQIMAILNDPRSETPKPGDIRLRNSQYRIVATQADALRAASALGTAWGLKIVDLGTKVEGEARDVAQNEAEFALRLAVAGEPALVLAGGEMTVTLGAEGSGGPNREYALALALALNAHPAIWALAADTDGIDGTDDGAGAIVVPDTLARARSLGLDPRAALAAHDSGAFFAKLGDALVTGPTRTNVADFRVLLIDPARNGIPVSGPA